MRVPSRRERLCAAVFSTLFALLVAAPACADEFSWQISGGLGEQEIDGSLEADDLLIGAIYYFDPVDDGDGPYALAAFLNPVSRVSIRARGAEQTIEGPLYTFAGSTFSSPATEHETREYSLDGRHVWRKSKWYLGGRYSKANLDESVYPLLDQTYPESYGLWVGKYLAPRTAIELAVNSADQTVVTSSLCFSVPCVPVPITTEFETRDASLNATHAGKVGSMTYALSGHVSKSRTDVAIRVPPIPPPPVTSPLPPSLIGVIGNPRAFPSSSDFSRDPVRTYGLAADFFPTGRVGVRLGYADIDGGRLSDSAYDLATTWFFKRRIAIEFAVARTEFGAGYNIRSHAVRLFGRF
jgi:hypothetical protein